MPPRATAGILYMLAASACTHPSEFAQAAADSAAVAAELECEVLEVSLDKLSGLGLTLDGALQRAGTFKKQQTIRVLHSGRLLVADAGNNSARAAGKYRYTSAVYHGFVFTARAQWQTDGNAQLRLDIRGAGGPQPNSHTVRAAIGPGSTKYFRVAEIMSESRSTTTTPILSDIPYFGPRYFTHHGIGRDRWALLVMVKMPGTNGQSPTAAQPVATAAR